MSFKPTPDEVFAMPLASLEAIFLDTETTGLNVSSDRIIEIGAQKMHQNAKTSGETFSMFVDPELPIPEQSTAIHHINDKMVKGAPKFPEAMQEFNEWAGPSVIIGYSIGFDIGILKSEHERHEIKFTAPKTLDVRHLSQIVLPELPDQSLEMTASWLDIEIVDRHRALADAHLALKVFAGLVPKLAEKGIVTLAQAKNACHKLTGALETEARAGWHQLDSEPDVKSSFKEYARIDSFPYRHQVGEMMDVSPTTIPPDMALQAALGVMLSEKKKALFVEFDKKTNDYGIVTETDFLKCIVDKGKSSLNVKVRDIAKKPLVTIRQSDYIYRAMTKLATLKFRHLAVVNRSGKLVGCLSLRNLLYQRAEQVVSLGDNLRDSSTPGELGQIWGTLTSVAKTLYLEDVDARNIAAIISKELRALTARAAELAEGQMIKEKHGKPPCEYVVMVLGSGGRGESLLAMDQDNALLYERALKTKKEEDWFQLLGTKIADILHEAGVPYCPGSIMTSNPEWRGSFAEWKKRVSGWITRSKPDDILKCDIYFDSLPVYGEEKLAQDLYDHALEKANKAPNFQKLLEMNANDFKVPTGLFGGLKLKEGRVDLKMGGILPIFSAARVLAIKQGVKDRSTPMRLKAFAKTNSKFETVIENLSEAHKILLNLILKQQLDDISNGLPLANKVDPKDLSSFEEDELKWALDQLPSISDLLEIPTPL